jgi:hypothetical protein
VTRTTTPAPRTTRTDRRLLALLGVVIAGLVVWQVAIIVDGAPVPLVFHAAAVVHLLIGGMGAFLLLRTDARRLGWLLCLQTLFLVSFIGPPVFMETGAAWAGAMEALGGLPLAFLMAATILYPTGYAESRVLAALVGLATLGIIVGCTHWLGVNLGWWEPLTDPLELAIALTTLPLFASFVEQARIYRRRPVLQQKQLKWYVLGLLAVPMYAVPGLLGWSEEAFAVVDAATTALFPIAILIGVTRYRLYEIDRIVSRTVAYALVIATLALLGIGGVTGLTSLLPTRDDLAVALSTVAVVALFDPLRRRVVDAVDRRFDRTRYVARQVVEGFGRDVRDVTDLDEVREHIDAVLARTVAPASIAVWQPSKAVSP